MKSENLPGYHFEGEVVVKEEQGYTQGYLDFPFDVPAGVGELRLRLQYAPLRVGSISNLITLALFDPGGFRGNAHRHPPDEEVVLSSAEAAPGFLKGPIPPGKWLAQLAIHAVVVSDPPCCRYSLDIKMRTAEAVGTVEAAGPRKENERYHLPERVEGRPAGWFHGELHSHTLHSDGKQTFPELIAQARQRQLDFLAVTDHNTITAPLEADGAARSAVDLDGLLVIPGIELTTFHGHALVLGVDQWVDWRTGYNGWTMEDAARAARRLGALFIMAHPNDIGNPFCTGCHWEYPEIDLELVDAVEIWNGTWRGEGESNAVTLKTWQAWQLSQQLPKQSPQQLPQQESQQQADQSNSGEAPSRPPVYLPARLSARMPATCGSDFHRPRDFGPGVPSIYVYAGQLSRQAILEGVRQGRIIITTGPWLELQASAAFSSGNSSACGDAAAFSSGNSSACGDAAAGETAPARIGDTLSLKGRPAALAIRWEQVPPGARLVLRDCRGIVFDQSAAEAGEMDHPLAPGEDNRFWLELYDGDQNLLALTNPVFVEG